MPSVLRHPGRESNPVALIRLNLQLQKIVAVHQKGSHSPHPSQIMKCVTQPPRRAAAGGGGDRTSPRAATPPGSAPGQRPAAAAGGRALHPSEAPERHAGGACRGHMRLQLVDVDRGGQARSAPPYTGAACCSWRPYSSEATGKTSAPLVETTCACSRSTSTAAASAKRGTPGTPAPRAAAAGGDRTRPRATTAPGSAPGQRPAAAAGGRALHRAKRRRNTPAAPAWATCVCSRSTSTAAARRTARDVVHADTACCSWVVAIAPALLAKTSARPAGRRLRRRPDSRSAAACSRDWPLQDVKKARQACLTYTSKGINPPQMEVLH